MPKGLQGFQKGHKGFGTKESYNRASLAHKGLKHSEETKRKISIAHKGKNFSGIENGKKTRFKATGHSGIKLLGKSGYRNLHKWVVKQLGQPNTCEKCGKTDLTGRQIHWVNKSKKYKKNINDWERLCVRCHFYKDKY